jgi:hypothetical protein
MAQLADVILLVHFGYVLFVVGGLALIWLGWLRGWRWVRKWWFRVLHLGAIVLVALEALAGVVCPLTWLEDVIRPGAIAGAGFIQRWIHALLFWDFPLWVFTLAHVAFALLIVATFVLFPPDSRR